MFIIVTYFFKKANPNSNTNPKPNPNFNPKPLTLHHNIHANSSH